MKLKEAIYQVTNDPNRLYLDSLRQNGWRRNVSVFPHRIGRNDDYEISYSKEAEKMERHIKTISKTLTFDFGIWGNVTAKFGVKIGSWYEVEPYIYFASKDAVLSQMLWGLSFELPANFDFAKPESFLRKILAAKFYSIGFTALVQRHHGCEISEVLHWYKWHKSATPDIYKEESKAIRKIEKHFNLESEVPFEKLVSFVNQNGVLETKVKLSQYDSDWFFNSFDGDVDELEEEFNNSLEPNTIYL